MEWIILAAFVVLFFFCTNRYKDTNPWAAKEAELVNGGTACVKGKVQDDRPPLFSHEEYMAWVNKDASPAKKALTPVEEYEEMLPKISPTSGLSVSVGQIDTHGNTW